VQGTDEFNFRDVSAEDIDEICRFPRTPLELCYIFPKAPFPLMPGILMEQIRKRRCSTVMTVGGTVAGFANLYDIGQGDRCWIGNLILGPEFRGRGAGARLVRYMMGRAVGDFAVRKVLVACINENTPALMLYMKLGFRPFAAEPRTGPDGRPLAAIQLERDMQ